MENDAYQQHNFIPKEPMALHGREFVMLILVNLQPAFQPPEQ